MISLSFLVCLKEAKGEKLSCVCWIMRERKWRNLLYG